MRSPRRTAHRWRSCSNAEALGLGDFNGDGTPDLAVADANGGDVGVFLGNGEGGFTAAPGSPFPVGTAPFAVAVGDFNGDGKPDLAVANSQSDNVSAARKRRRGFTSAPGSPIPFGTQPYSLAVGDFNGDGRPDLAVVNYADDDVSVLLGDGSGGFTPGPGSPITVGSAPISVAVGDFDGDGRTDLAVVNQGDDDVSVLLGNGSGGFTPAPGSPFPVGTNPLSVAVGDFNGDGMPDLAVTNSESDNVSVLLNQGSPPKIPAGSILIDELRLSGPQGADDQYVELYNATSSPTGLGGWSLVGSGGQRVAIPAGTVIPAFGHLLLTGPIASSTGYGLDAYGAANLELPSGNLAFKQASSGVKLVSPRGATIDAVGFDGAPTGFYSGTPLSLPTTFSGDQYAFTRKISGGLPVNSGDNAADFTYVDAGTGAGVAGFGSPELGAPAPAGLASPVARNELLQPSLFDPLVAASASPNQIYTPGSPGLLLVNRSLTNCSGQPPTGLCANAGPPRAAQTATALRFRVTSLTTTGSPGVGPGQSVLLAESSPGGTYTPTGGTSTVIPGMPLDAPPSAAGLGGLNSSWTATADLPSGGLAPGATINIQFAFSVKAAGTFGFTYDAEADLVPATGQPPPPVAYPLAPASLRTLPTPEDELRALRAG